jgi:hypothetical protein
MIEKKIPTILGLIVLIVVVFITTFSLSGAKSLFTSASPDITPKKVIISNIDESSFTVSWLTDVQTSGFVRLDNRTFRDVRDALEGETGNFTTHFVRVDGLRSNVRYNFKIGSGSSSFFKMSGSQNNVSCEDGMAVSLDGEMFSVKTSPSRGVAPSDPVSGLVLSSDGKTPLAGAVFCLSVSGFYPLSVLTTEPSNGLNFFLNLGDLRKTGDFSLGKYKASGDEERFVVMAGGDLLASGSCLTGQDEPMSPEIIIGDNNYQCGKERSQLTPTPRKSQSFLPDGTTSGLEASSSGVSIDSPSSSDVVSDDLPTFKGRGSPGQVIQIMVESENPLSDQIRVRPDGTWSWTPPSNLAPGEHTVTLTIVDDKGNKQIITRRFTVVAGNPILPITSGSSSATLTPTPEALVTPSIVPTRTPTPTPYIGKWGDETPFVLLLTTGVTSVMLGLAFLFINQKTRGFYS